MKVSNEEVTQRMADFEKACRAAGAKLTHQRREIFREVAQSTEHPDAEKVFQRVRKRMPTISLDTVYRTLWWLKDLGLVSMLGPQRERARFDANLDHHHHFVCSRCGLTRDFYSKEFDALTLPDSVKSIGQARTIQIEAVGLCNRCASKSKSQSNK